jgi:hypothetical protein
MYKNMGKFLIITGGLILLTGVIVYFFDKFSFRRFPGDIFIKKDNFTFYFPLGISILISIILSLILFFVNKR